MLDLLLAAVITAGGYDDGRLLCRFQSNDITESSGLVASSAYDDLLYTHNDSGDVARVFQVDRSCRQRALLVLRGVDSRDWEAMSRGPGGTLWLGDIGDNSATRERGLLVHRVPDPGPVDGVVQVPSTSFRLTYEDGPRDAEALLVHPRTGQLLVVTKGFAGGGVYAAPLPLRAGEPNVMRRVGEVRIPEVTAGDISPDGSRVVLRNYSDAFEWEVDGDDVVAALGADPVTVSLPRSSQGEAISYSRDGRSLIVSSEGIGAPVHELRPAVPSDRPRADPSAAMTTAPDPSDGGATRGAFLVLAAVAGAGALLGLRLRRLRGSHGRSAR